MSKLVDKERLAKLAQGLDARMKAAVAAEKSRAEGKEVELATAIATEKSRAEGQEAAIRGEMATEATRVNQKIAADIATESALRVAEEARIEGKVDTEAAKAREEEGKLAQAIAQEVQDRKDAVQGVQDQLNALAGDGEGSIVEQLAALEEALEKAIADGDAAVTEAFGKADEALHTTISAEIDEDVQVVADALADQMNEEKEGSLAKKIADEVARAVAKEGELAGAIETEKGRAEGAEKALADRIAVFEGTGEGSVKAQIQAVVDAQAEVNEDFEGRIAANEAFVAAQPGKDAKIREDFAAADAQVLADAKKYADEEITKLVDSAPEAMNTLNELAEAIKGNKDVYDAYVEEHAIAMASMKTELQAEIDSDVKVVSDALAAEVERADAAEKANKKAIEDANAAQKLVNEDFEERVAANEAFVAAQPAIDAKQDERIKALEDANKEGGAMAEAVAAAQAAADAAQKDVDAIEKRLDDEGGLVDRLEAAEAFVEAQPAKDEAQDAAIEAVEGRCDVLEQFVKDHSHAQMEQDIKDNAAAITQEVADRNDAIAAALEAYSTTEEMKAVIGNVVNSLSLTMEGDKVVLKLGGVDGIELTSVDLDLASDDDIAGIIAGLDTAE